ncbi:PepSY-associated TM helix domain-containing protein [Kordiimonas pumila]|uniref:PepSY-associated TM helix domain-containing protein n=1 Tax=Kordiimonas pumila TaxID=2161677 RepID=A0ABV7D7L9_9PROT|nr:PepSY-associated TM helix domain-containing protein [Kordiimonas pumila]
MRTDIIKLYKDIHTWVGICSGLALFIAFYAGAITMFEKQINDWASPPSGIEAPLDLAETDRLLNATIEAYPEVKSSYQIHLYPSPSTPSSVMWHIPLEPEKGRRSKQAYYAASFAGDGTVLKTKLQKPELAHFINILHQQVGLPFSHEIAMPIMGVIALLYSLALVSGTIILIPSLVKDLFLLRIGKNLKRMWLDVHNVLGIFSLPFHIVMALTSVIFAFHDQIYDTQNVVLYDNKIADLWATGTLKYPQHPENTPLLAVPTLIEKLAVDAPDFRPTILHYTTQPEKQTTLRIDGTDSRRLLRGPTYGIANADPYTGELVGTGMMPGRQDGWGSALTSFFALHFGGYGGISVRWGYFFMGLAGAFLFYSGNLLWVESRRKKARRGANVEQKKSTEFMGSLTVGVSLGSIIGLSLTIAAAKWLHSFAGDLGAWHSGLYYIAFLAAIGVAFAMGAAKACVTLLHTAALTTLLIPLSSLIGLITDNTPTFYNSSTSALSFDFVAAIGSLCFALMAKRASRRIAEGPTDSIWSAAS